MLLTGSIQRAATSKKAQRQNRPTQVLSLGCLKTARESVIEVSLLGNKSTVYDGKNFWNRWVLNPKRESKREINGKNGHNDMYKMILATSVLYKRCRCTDSILLLTGLRVDTADDLIQRRQQFGANTVPTKQSRMFLHFLWEAIQDMTLIILIVAAIVSFGLSFYEAPERTGSVCKRAACL